MMGSRLGGQLTRTIAALLGTNFLLLLTARTVAATAWAMYTVYRLDY